VYELAGGSNVASASFHSICLQLQGQSLLHAKHSSNLGGSVPLELTSVIFKGLRAMRCECCGVVVVVLVLVLVLVLVVTVGWRHIAACLLGVIVTRSGALAAWSFLLIVVVSAMEMFVVKPAMY